MKKSKKIAVVASGWHFPYHFYEILPKMMLPRGYKAEFFCVSHRDPKYAIEEKKSDRFDDSIRGKLDSRLYSSIATKEDIEKLGWKYVEEPNTVGDWGNTNQWLDKNDYKQYSLFFFTHDDNLFLSERLFVDIISDGSFMEWDILANSLGMPQGTIRGSCEFFKPRVIELMGGKFDLSATTLSREGKTDSPKDWIELYDWNNNNIGLNKVIENEGLKTGFLSPSYRVSAFCIEGERGYISRTNGQNTVVEDEGLRVLKEAGII